MDNDDLQEEQKVQEAMRQETVRREMYRKSMDTCRVYNPTNLDYKLIWDGYSHTIPNKNKDLGFGKGMWEFERFYAIKYTREMANKILNDESQADADELIKEMQKTLPKPLTPYEKQEFIERTYKHKDEQYVKILYNTLFLGVTREFGIEEAPERIAMPETDIRPVDERIFSAIGNKRYTAPDIEPKQSEPIPVGSYPITRHRKDITSEVAQ